MPLVLRQLADLGAVIGGDKLFAHRWRNTFDLAFRDRMHKSVLGL